MDGLLRGRRGIRAAGSFREVLSGVGHVDHHAHGILRARPGTLDEFRGLFSESPDPRRWPHASERRLAADPMDYASAMLRATGTELLLVDDGYTPADVCTSWQELGKLAHTPSRPVLRIERVP